MTLACTKHFFGRLTSIAIAETLLGPHSLMKSPKKSSSDSSPAFFAANFLALQCAATSARLLLFHFVGGSPDKIPSSNL